MMKETKDRRQALKQISLLVGGTVASPTLLSVLQSCEQAPPPLDWQAQFLDESQARLVNRLAEMIIPATDTPGALEAGVPYFIDTMLDQCLEPKAQSLFVEGLNRVQASAQNLHQKSFLELPAEDQIPLLGAIAKEDYAQEPEIQDYRNPRANSFFKQLKQLTLLGYFNSQLGATKALEYLQIPGGYEGCTDLEEGQKAWAI